MRKRASTWRALFQDGKPVIGVVHLPPLPGSPHTGSSTDAALARALRDAAVLAEAGIDAVLVENYGDAPFRKDRVDPATVASMTRIVSVIGREHPGLPLGVNVLRNDALAALAVAEASGACFVRVNVLAGAVVTDQGVIEGRAARIIEARNRLAPHVGIFADVRVKHAAPLAERPLADEVAELVERAGADAVLVTGPATGRPPDAERLREARRAAGDAPVLVASGATSRNARVLLELADGVIVGTSLKRGGRTSAPPDRRRVRAFLEAAGRG